MNSSAPQHPRNNRSQHSRNKPHHPRHGRPARPQHDVPQGQVWDLGGGSNAPQRSGHAPSAPRPSHPRPHPGGPRNARPAFGWPRPKTSSRNSHRKPAKQDYRQYISAPVSQHETVKPYEVLKTFEDFGVNKYILAGLQKKGFTKPTEIQEKTIQAIIDGRDVLALANTGSGKTAAFLIPLVHRMLSGIRKKTLVLVPTRELAEQVRQEFLWIAGGTFLRATTIVGGESAGAQIRSLKLGGHCIIATPGRLWDLHNRGLLNFGEYAHLVLDEFDRMLDMGFVNDIKRIVALLPSPRQSLLFSATMSRDIERHVHAMLVNPEQITIKSEPVGMRVKQDVIWYTSGTDKRQKLHALLEADTQGKYLIFTRTKREADHLCHDLLSLRIAVEALHGDKSQYVRQKITNKFRTNQIRILIATDVAARGLDIPDVTHVVNYDEPANREDYIHRIGRTARAGKTGSATTFVRS